MSSTQLYVMTAGSIPPDASCAFTYPDPYGHIVRPYRATAQGWPSVVPQHLSSREMDASSRAIAKSLGFDGRQLLPHHFGR
jgi:hypothetical protein